MQNHHQFSKKNIDGMMLVDMAQLMSEDIRRYVFIGKIGIVQERKGIVVAMCVNQGIAVFFFFGRADG